MGIPQAEVLSRFKSLDCASVCDASPLAKSMEPGLKQTRTGLKMAGKAHTVACTNDYLTVIKAMDEANPGEVIVVDGRGQSQAIFGELLAAEAIRKELAGAIIDGAIRDLSGIVKMGFPMYYRWLNPQAGRAEIIEPPCSVVSVGGVTVTHGDWILGDDDGIVVIPEAQIELILDVAQEIQKLEEKVSKNVNAGKTLKHLLGLEEFRREHERDIRTRLEAYLTDSEEN